MQKNASRTAHRIKNNLPMTKSSRNSISIAPDHNQPTLSKGQKAFNALLKRIEKQREVLRAWEAARPVFHRKYVGEYVPLDQASDDARTKLVYRLDKAYAEKGLTKAERRTIANVITSLAGELAKQTGDTDLKALYNRYSMSDFDDEANMALDDMKSTLEEMLGVEVSDDVDLRSPEEIMQFVHAQMEQREAEEAAASQAREARRASRKKTAKQVAAETRQQAEEAELSLSIREVYRKLASALHPDRETDPEERARKTVLMQRANQAYRAKSLLQLLELQLELEHIDQSAMNNIGEDRLKHYNKILKDQVSELDQEILHTEHSFKDSYGLSPMMRVSPGTILGNLAAEIFSMQQNLRQLEQDLRDIDDLKQFKLWLRAVKRSMDSDYFEDAPS